MELITPSITFKDESWPGLRPTSYFFASANQPLLAVIGPTGAGKSELALTLAETFQGEIVNFDSVQVYRGLDVGSAKLPELERRGIPHHLIDILDVEEELTAGGFAQRATAMLEKISERGNLPILAGGTGFYLRALLEGLSPAPLRDESYESD